MKELKPKCSIKGCNNNRRGKGRKKNGEKIYGLLCQSHHNIKYGFPNTGSYQKRKKISKEDWKDVQEISKQPCARCGWNESYCDRHRIISGKNGGKYTKNNVISLCPNCHRIEHRGRI